MYLYFRKQLGWGVITFGAYMGAFGLLTVFSQLVIIPYMSDNLKLKDMTIGIYNKWILDIQYFIFQIFQP